MMGLFGHHHAFTGDPLGRFYTPLPLAAACVGRVRELVPELHRLEAYEPSVGAGAFVRPLKALGMRVVGVDVDPGAAGLALCDRHLLGDWPEIASTLHTSRRAGRLVIGNPPFGGPDAPGRAPGDPAYIGAHHVVASVRVASVVAFILPAAWLMFEPAEPRQGGERSPMELWEHERCLPSIAFPIARRAWDNLREAALYVWIDRLGGACVRGPRLEW